VLQLYTFTISHFSEKARWALDFEGIAYRERVLVPGAHLLVTRRIARKSEVPVLAHDGHPVQGSGAILDYIADRLGGRKLTPADAARRAAARELEQRIDLAFGRGVQRMLYSEMLDDRAALTELWAAGGPFWARAFFRVGYPLMAFAVRRRYRTSDPAAVAAAQQRFVARFDELDAVLARQPYLGGDSPDRTDLTAAALLAPICAPPEHIVKWPPLPSALAGFVAQLQGRPTWDHALRMYREHRRNAAATA
jgi:glutathione S-transferase